MAIGRDTERRSRTSLFDLFDGIEAAFYAIGALTLLVCLVVLGVRAFHRLVGPAGSGAAILAGLIVLAVLVRDIRRKAWSVVSISVAGLYGAALAAVVALEFRSLWR